MTTNIDELIERAGKTVADIRRKPTPISDVIPLINGMADALRSQQKRIAELEREAESTISQLRQVQVRMNYWHDRTGEAEAKLSAVRQAVEEANASQSRHYKDCMLVFEADWQAILDAVKDAPAQQPASTSAQVPEGLLGVIERIEAVLCCPEGRCVSFANEHDNYEMSSALTDLRAMLSQPQEG